MGAGLFWGQTQVGERSIGGRNALAAESRRPSTEAFAMEPVQAASAAQAEGLVGM